MKVHATFRPFGSFPSLRYFLVCCVFTSCLVAGQTTKHVLLGQEVTLTTDIKPHPEEILWKHNGNKVVEFNGQTQQQFGSYQGRVTLDWLSADLHIVNLSFEDSGDYELQAFANNKLLESFHYLLEVIDRVAKPTISCVLNNGSSSGKSGLQATLTCSTESKQSQSSLEFDWFSDGKKQIGPNLIIPLGDAHDDHMYNCTVSNKFSKESATFTAKECYSDKSLNTLLIVCVCVVVVVMVLILTFGLYMLCRKGSISRKKTNDVEKQANLDTTNELENNEERQVLLDRTPTIPSHQTLHHLVQNHKDLDPIQKDSFVKELKQSIKQRSSSRSENHNPVLRTSPFPPVPEKPHGSLDLSSNKEQADEDMDIVPTAEEDNITSSSLPVPEKPPRLQEPPANDEKHGDEVDLGKTMESKVTECDTEDSEKTNDANSDKKEEAAKSEGDVPVTHVDKPGSRLSSQNTNSSPEGEQKQEVSSDQAARESDCSSPGESGEKLPTTPPHEQQFPLTNANPGEKILQEGDKPDGLSDREETDHCFNPHEEPQSLTKSEPDNSNTDMVLESPDTEHTVPDDKDEDKTRHNSENSPEKGGTENNVTKEISHPPLVPQKSNNVKKFVRKNKEKADENKPPEAVEDKPSESSPESEEADVSDKHDSDKKEEAAKSEGDVPVTHVDKPGSRLSSQNTNSSPEGEQNQEVSSDQAARESDCPGESGEKLPTTPPHEQQPPPTETNPREEILQEGDKQVPGDKAPDGLSDREETDFGFNTLEKSQSLTESKPDNSNTDTVLESPDTEHTVPDDKDKDKTRHNSKNSPEKGDKSEAAEDKNANQS